VMLRSIENWCLLSGLQFAERENLLAHAWARRAEVIRFM
jgi:hypothetical protein